VEPMLVARLAVLAQASAWVGAVLAGLWAGVLLHTGPALGRLDAASGDTVTAILGVVLAVALTVAALWLEHVCKVPPGEDDTPEPDDGARA
jgi:predicted outer membrane lipoprotein